MTYTRSPKPGTNAHPILAPISSIGIKGISASFSEPTPRKHWSRSVPYLCTTQPLLTGTRSLRFPVSRQIEYYFGEIDALGSVITFILWVYLPRTIKIPLASRHSERKRSRRDFRLGFLVGQYKKLCMYKVVILSLVALLSSCESSRLKECTESESSVSPACLYGGGYPACQLGDEEYELARKNAWEYAEGGFTGKFFVNTGKSQDLGQVCRFYIHRKLKLASTEPYQWMVYVDKDTLQATHMLPVMY